MEKGLINTYKKVNYSISYIEGISKRFDESVDRSNPTDYMRWKVFKSTGPGTLVR